MANPIPITLHVNGQKHSLEVRPNKTLLRVLREELGLLGTKSNCVEGECGACTVLLDGQAVNSCLLLAVRAQGREITTIEGIGKPDHLHPVQEACIAADSIQCGYCTPGFIMSTVALLEANSAPTEEEMVHALSGNICRCTGYVKIRQALEMLIESEGERAE